MKVKIVSLICGSCLGLSFAYANQVQQVPPATPIKNTANAPVELLYTQMAESASIKLNQNSNTATLTLNDVNKKTVWFTDHPERQGGVMSTAHFISEWQVGFQADPPNANMVALRESNTHNDPKSLGSFELSNPIYNAKTHTLSYTIKSLSGKLHDMKQINDAVVFIDSQIPMLGCTPSGKGC